MDKKTEALKLALGYMDETLVTRHLLAIDRKRYVMEALREALAEESSGTEQPAQQQEPKVLMQEIARLHDRIKDLEWDVEFLSRSAQQQEPVAYMNPQDMEKMKRLGRGSVAWATPTDFCTQPVYTSPPANANAGKPWVHATTWRGLTDEEINEFFEGMEPNNGFWLSFARAIEAKLKEKNNG